MRLRPWSALVVIAVLVLGYFAIGGRSGSGSRTVSRPASVPALSWNSCTGKDAPEAPFECADLKAPINYEEPDGDTLTVALVRLPATASKSGIILVNPGGPGGSGFNYVAYQGAQIASTLQLQNYDLVGFDPRGVDRSDAIKCQSDAEFDKFLYVDSTPDTPDEQKLYDEGENAFVTACRKKYGDDLVQFSTENTARDMDLIRRAMGASTLNYIGISYGTYLGGVYATLFPETTGTFYLDGAFDPAGDTVEQQYTTQMEGFEKAFNNWATECESDRACAFHANDVGARWDALLDKLDKTSITADDGREVNNAVMSTATTAALYAKGMWSQLSSALAAAEKGKGTQLIRLADGYNDRSEDGTFGSLMQAFPVIQCASGMGSPAPDDPAALVKKLKEVAPRRAKDVTVEDFDTRECDGLMDDPPIIEIDYKGSAPIVVVGGKNDPATPFRWSEEMVANLGSGARLVVYTGEGHGQILNSKCVDAISRRLFSSDTVLPRDRVVCDPDPVVAKPAFWGRIPRPSTRDTVIQRDLGDGYVGMTNTQIFAEYRAIAGSSARVFQSLSRSLVSAGFTANDPSASDASKGSQYFTFGNEVLGVLVISESDLKKNGFLAPDGPVPVGHSLVVLFYFPPEE